MGLVYLLSTSVTKLVGLTESNTSKLTCLSRFPVDVMLHKARVWSSIQSQAADECPQITVTYMALQEFVIYGKQEWSSDEKPKFPKRYSNIGCFTRT